MLKRIVVLALWLPLWVPVFGARPKLSLETGAHRAAVRPGRRGRHHHAHHRAEDERGPRTAGGGGEHAGRRRHPRRRNRGARRARRPHAAPPHQRQRGEPGAVQVAALRPGQRLRHDLDGGVLQHGDRHRRGFEGEDAAGSDRDGEGQSRQDEHRHHHARRHAASRRRAVPLDCGHRCAGGAAQDHRRGDHRGAQRQRGPRASTSSHRCSPASRPARCARSR